MKLYMALQYRLKRCPLKEEGQRLYHRKVERLQMSCTRMTLLRWDMKITSEIYIKETVTQRAMKTMEEARFVDRVVDTLRKAATEIEELQVKAALGKYEAQDKFESAKKSFNAFLHESKQKIREGEEKAETIHAKLDALRVQLALGKAETLDAFKAQKKALLSMMRDLEVDIKSNRTLKDVYTFALMEIDKFKVKLEVLERKFEKSNESPDGAFNKGKEKFNGFIDGLKNKYGKAEESRWENFQEEVSEAFSHLKKAFEKK